MLTRLRVRNFKNLESLDIELGQTVVFIGPNNSGKTSALQALALWKSGMDALFMQQFLSDSPNAATAPVALNRLMLTHTPVSDTRLLWNGTRIEENRTANSDEEHPGTPILMQILVAGQVEGRIWECELEFYHGNSESIYCQPATPDWREGEAPNTLLDQDMARVVFLPPMSGLVPEETEIPSGRVDVLIGEGQTAQILRNLCLRVLEKDPDAWQRIKGHVQSLFGIELGDPARRAARGSIMLIYKERDWILDIASAGRGLQQTLLLLAHLYANPDSTLLLDEPDAHLEILRQRQTYNMLTECAAETGSQIIAASHSEIILNEAADRDVVIAFVGRPHRINDRGSQVLKALREIGFDQYYQAEIKGSVLYLEGATDLAILRALALKLKHPAAEWLEQPFVHYVAALPNAALHHFHGLREARSDLIGFALFDRLERGLPSSFTIPAHTWRKCEIENYIASRDVLLRFAEPDNRPAMEQTLDEVEKALHTLGKDPWSDDIKTSEEVLPAIFANFYKHLGLRNIMAKADFHVLVNHLAPTEIAPEVTEVLDMLDATLRRSSLAGSS